MSSSDTADDSHAGRASSFFSASAERDNGDGLAKGYPVHGPNASVEEQLSLVLEASRVIGWWDWDVPNDRLYAGRQFANLYGVDPLDAERGEHLASFMEGVDPRDRDRIAKAVQKAVDCCGPFLEEYRIVRHDHDHRRPIWVMASGHCYGDEDGSAVRFPGVIMEITKRKTSDMRKQALIELGDRLRDLPDMQCIVRAAATILADLLSPGRAGFGIVDNAAKTVFIPTDWHRADMESVAGTYDFSSYGPVIEELTADRLVFIENVEKDARTAGSKDALADLGIVALLNVPIVEHGKLVLVAFAHNDGPVDWDTHDLNFVHAVADRVQVALARLRAENRQEMLNRELSHRLKNSLAMAQSIVSQSLRSASDLKTVKEDVGRRLSVLGRAHEILLSGSSEEADIAMVVRNALLPYQEDQKRIHTEGPRIALSGPAALSLSLILHELATNALKHGSLSNPDGHVELCWRKEASPKPRMILRWTEKGGPAAAEPTRLGFGSRLIRYGITGATDQSISMDYGQEGLVCELSVAMAEITVDMPADPTTEVPAATPSST